MKYVTIKVGLRTRSTTSKTLHTKGEGGGQKAGTWTSLKFRNYLQSMLQKANAYKRILLLSLKLCFVTLNQLLKWNNAQNDFIKSYVWFVIFFFLCTIIIIIILNSISFFQVCANWWIFCEIICNINQVILRNITQTR